jgi:hypothetical protein
MDRGTRVYAAVLAALVLALVFAALYQPAKVSRLNALLADEPALADYTYPFRVLSVEGRIAAMSSPRSPVMPVQQMIGAIHPELKNTPVDEAAYLRAQQQLADHQARAKALVLSDPDIDAVRWVLDETWLARRGIRPAP